jgi:hypothetical protein
LAAFLSAWVTGAAAGSLACAKATDDRQPAINAAEILDFMDRVIFMRYLRETRCLDLAILQTRSVKAAALATYAAPPPP